MTQASCLYQGMLRHRRFEPIEIGFRYPVRFLYLDLAELDDAFGDSRLWSIENRAPARFLRTDHLGPANEPLDASVRHLLKTRMGWAPAGPIRLLTQPRVFGFLWNPLSLYYCFEADGQTLTALVAEVKNTPWGEHHCYVLDLTTRDSDQSSEARARRRSTSKSFHASPFMEMAMQYEWRVRTPGRTLTLSILSEHSNRPPSKNREYGAPYSQADLVLNRREIDPGSLRSTFWQSPLVPLRTRLAGYWQAWRLVWRRVSISKHPNDRWPRTLDDPRLLEMGSFEESKPKPRSNAG
jgi:DUF1365 family protein